MASLAIVVTQEFLDSVVTPVTPVTQDIQELVVSLVIQDTQVTQDTQDLVETTPEHRDIVEFLVTQVTLDKMAL